MCRKRGLALQSQLSHRWVTKSSQNNQYQPWILPECRLGRGIGQDLGNETGILATVGHVAVHPNWIFDKRVEKACSRSVKYVELDERLGRIAELNHLDFAIGQNGADCQLG